MNQLESEEEKKEEKEDDLNNSRDYGEDNEPSEPDFYADEDDGGEENSKKKVSKANFNYLYYDQTFKYNLNENKNDRKFRRKKKFYQRKYCR